MRREQTMVVDIKEKNLIITQFLFQAYNGQINTIGHRLRSHQSCNSIHVGHSLQNCYYQEIFIVLPVNLYQSGPFRSIGFNQPYKTQQNYLASMEKMSLLSPQNIRNHLANNSPSKVAHAFPKGKRFKYSNPECKEAFYCDNKSEFSPKKTIIGKGKRYDFTKRLVETPGSPAYIARSDFTRLNRTFTFGVSREQSPERSYLYRFMKTRVPGPGAYENQVHTRSTISYTHRSKTIDVIAKHFSFLQSPGPNQYDSVQLNPKNGKFKVSRFSDTKFSVIGKSKRFKDSKEKTPGPATYKTLDNFNSKGKFVLSQRRGKGTRPFDRQMKFTFGYWKANENPGPADYQKPSQFGEYGDSRYYKTLRATR